MTKVFSQLQPILEESFVLNGQDMGKKSDFLNHVDQSSNHVDGHQSGKSAYFCPVPGRNMHSCSMFRFHCDPISHYLKRVEKCFDGFDRTSGIVLLDPCQLNRVMLDIHDYVNCVAGNMREMFRQSACDTQNAQRFFILLLWCHDHKLDASAQSMAKVLYVIFQKTPWGLSLAEYANTLLKSKGRVPKDIKSMMHKIDAHITSCFQQQGVVPSLR